METMPSPADADLRRAMMEALLGGAGTAGAIVHATRHSGVPMSRRRHALMAMLSEGQGLVCVPLSMITAETTVLALDLRKGGSSAIEFRRRLGAGSSRRPANDVTEREWTLTRAVGRTDAGRVPYAVREATNVMRPAACAIPFSPLQAGEALRLRANFGAGGLISALLFVE